MTHAHAWVMLHRGYRGVDWECENCKMPGGHGEAPVPVEVLDCFASRLRLLVDIGRSPSTSCHECHRTRETHTLDLKCLYSPGTFRPSVCVICLERTHPDGFECSCAYR